MSGPDDAPGQVTVQVLASGATADVVAWGDDQVLKLFRDTAPHHAHEAAAAQAAFRAGVLVPAVGDGVVEVDGRDGIFFERVDGPTMAQYLDATPARAFHCGQRAAAFHAAIHGRPVTDIAATKDIIAWGIERADDLDADTRERVLDILAALPDGTALTHGDFHPRNIILAAGDEARPVAIDWAAGARGEPEADFARTWLLSRLWLHGAPEQLHWQTFWQVYLRCYLGARPATPHLDHWKLVVTAASLGMDGALAFIPDAVELRRGYVEARLDGDTHLWC